MTDDLSAPLGMRKPARRPRKLTFAELHVVAGALGLSTIFLTGWMFLADKPTGRAPLAAAHTQVPDSNAAPIEADLRVIRLSPDDRPNVARAEPPPAAPRSRTITIIDGTSGRAQEIQIPISPDDGLETSSVEPAPIVEPRKPAPPPRPSTNNSRSSDPSAPRRTAGKPDAAVRVRASGN